MSNVTDRITPSTGPPAPEIPDAPQPSVGPHPNFWWAALWCVFLLLITQVPAALLAIVFLLSIAVRNPEAVKNVNSPAVGLAMLVAVVVSHSNIVMLSLIVLRVTAGRHWRREIALRLPSATHVLLTLALLPAFLILGSGLDALLRWAKFPSLSQPVPEPGQPPPPGTLHEVGAFWAAVLFTLLLAGLVQLLCGLIGGRDWYRSWVAPLSPAVKAALSVGLLVAGVGGCVGTYFLLLPAAADLLPEQAGLTGAEEMVKALTDLPLPVVVLVIAALPGVSEELWCRGFLGRGLVGKYGPFWGVLMASFYFGAIHGDPRQGTYALAMGVVLHLIYLCSRSLLVPMLLHFGNNALSVALVRVAPLKELDDGKGVSWHLFAAAGAVLVLCLVAFWQSRARLVGPWRPEYPGVACPPPHEFDTRVEAAAPPWPVVLLIVAALAGLGASLALALR